MNEYEVTDVFESGDAGSLIQADKTQPFNDELGGQPGPVMWLEDE